MKLSPSGESAMERVHSDALHEQKEMGWNRPRCVPQPGAHIVPPVRTAFRIEMQICYRILKIIMSTKKEPQTMLEYVYDTQLLIEGHDLDEDAIHDYITQNIPGDCLLAVGDESLIKVHFHTNIPWRVLEYCASLGDIFDIVVENMERQQNGLKG